MTTKEGCLQLIQRLFSGKTGLKLLYLEDKQSEFAIFRVYVPAGRQTKSGILIFFFTPLWHVTKFGYGFLCEPKYLGCLNFFNFISCFFSQIWLTLSSRWSSIQQHHRNRKEKTPDPHSRKVQPAKSSFCFQPVMSMFAFLEYLHLCSNCHSGKLN
jgi:hypothetical protein